MTPLPPNVAVAWPSLDNANVLGPWAHALKHTASPYTTQPSSPHSSLYGQALSLHGFSGISGTRGGLQLGSTVVSSDKGRGAGGGGGSGFDGSFSGRPMSFMMRSLNALDVSSVRSQGTPSGTQRLPSSHNSLAPGSGHRTGSTHGHNHNFSRLLPGVLLQQPAGGTSRTNLEQDAGSSTDTSWGGKAIAGSLQLGMFARGSGLGSSLHSGVGGSNAAYILSSGADISVELFGAAAPMQGSSSRGPLGTVTREVATAGCQEFVPNGSAVMATITTVGTSQGLPLPLPPGGSSSSSSKLGVEAATAATAPTAGADAAAAADAADAASTALGATPIRTPGSVTSQQEQQQLTDHQQQQQQDEVTVMYPADMPHHITPPPPPEEPSGRIWLTQQDVMNLATFHEEVTILFADIKGFTSLSNQLHPSQVKHLL